MQSENEDNKGVFFRKETGREGATREEDGGRERTPQVMCGLEVYGGRQES